ncbi:hypothetical protein MIND_00786300 [Mycena indigotica]|uniref:F-box domain-containing protein n=1 Tax=Mycena indigotica TaxID=2126181 RepID=A0A8H6SMS6_9AGAR|nr:uncharacterized protein MIND_00786300 [Mycena indigotica]KAF7302194.1 hypothetical protein MIND_00786300 [Mycena indigotica]
MEALWRALVNSRIGRWLLGLRFKFRPFSWLWAPRNGQDTTNKVVSPPLNPGLHGLNTDVFSDIFALLNGQDQQTLPSASRQLRSLFLPALFRRIKWAPLVQRKLPPPPHSGHTHISSPCWDIDLPVSANSVKSHYTAEVQT